VRPAGPWWPLFDRADLLIRDGRYEDGRTLLAEALSLIDAAPDQPYLPDGRAVALIALARVAFESGRLDDAEERIEEAVAHCLRTGLRVNLRAALGYAYDIHRYLGHTDTAVSDAELLAALHEGDEAVFHLRQAQIVRAGEPLVRVIAMFDGCRYELDDLPAVFRASGGTLRITAEFRRNRPSITRASRTATRAAADATAGRMGEALRGFAEARALDPFDPNPVYQAGIALLDTGDAAAAVQALDETERLAPGWFYCRRYAWLAQEVVDGRLSPVVAAVAIRVDDGSTDPAQRLSLLQSVRAAAGAVGMLDLYAGDALLQLGRDSDAAAAYRRGLTSVRDEDTRSALLLAVARSSGDPAERRGLLNEALALRGHLVSQAWARLHLELGPE
jgi:tetratricopeptide (TPR) repeat protein